jgi:hypothetical protein
MKVLMLVPKVRSARPSGGCFNGFAEVGLRFFRRKSSGWIGKAFKELSLTPYSAGQSISLLHFCELIGFLPKVYSHLSPPKDSSINGFSSTRYQDITRLLRSLFVSSSSVNLPKKNRNLSVVH